MSIWYYRIGAWLSLPLIAVALAFSGVVLWLFCVVAWAWEGAEAMQEAVNEPKR